MIAAYFETRFRLDGVVSEWPAEFVIISAQATTGQTWTTEQNAAADSLLEAELRTRYRHITRVVGYSPTSGHAEPGWAVSLPLGEACDLGQCFQQDAIYHVKDDALSVTHCDDRRHLIAVGTFRDRLDLPPVMEAEVARR